jgi:sorting nexin-25
MEFMDRRGRVRLVQFWLLVNNIKDPLEDADSDPLPQHSSWTDNDVDDLSAILNGYFSDPILDVDPPLREDLTTFVSDPSKATVEQYQQARKAILITQQSVYQTMEREDWPLFCKTDLWHKYLAAADSAPTTPARPSQPLAAISMTRSRSAGPIPSKPLSVVSSRNESATDLRKYVVVSKQRMPSGESQQSSDEASRNEDSFPPAPQQSEEDVVNAISAALNDIIKSDSKEKEDVASIHSRTSSDFGDARSSIEMRHRSTDLASLEEKRDTSTPQRDRVPIFDDDDDYRPDFAIDTLTRTSTDSDSRAIHLDVIEELEMVEGDIERLKREIRLTTSMIGKAELTGSYEELRLLKDSRASMERELERKEQLRRTYSTRGGESNLTVSTYLGLD